MGDPVVRAICLGFETVRRFRFDGPGLRRPFIRMRAIHFDGIAHNLVESALTTYTDPGYRTERVGGLHRRPARRSAAADGASHATATSFLAGRTLGVPAIDFSGHHPGPCDDQEPGAGMRDLFRVEFDRFRLRSFRSQPRRYTVYKVTALMAAPPTLHERSKPGRMGDVEHRDRKSQYAHPAPYRRTATCSLRTISGCGGI